MTEHDDLFSARGIVYACLASVVFWLGVVGVCWWAL